MNKRVEIILKQILENINPSKKELDLIKKELNKFLKNLDSKIKKSGLKVEVFVGGSFAKGTLIKKGKYDIDIFLRFEEEGDLSDHAKKILKEVKNVSEIHGSRDYFRVNASPSLFFEIVPVRKVKRPKEAHNITDLSYSHVNYVRRKVKSQKALNEIKIAKAFCHAQRCYGAESYVKGFSGYALELLIYHYGSFMKFIREISKVKDKEVIDIEKHHKNKRAVLMDINSSKLQSPIVLVDPTYKHRNVLAALSDETFRKFQESCRKFLESPSLFMFEVQKADLNKMKKEAEKNKNEFIMLEIRTDRQEGDIAGSKLLKFFNFLKKELSKYFELENSGFEYNEKKSAEIFFVARPKKEILIKGPRTEDRKHSMRFKKGKKTFVKNRHLYSKKKIDFSAREFITSWRNSNKKLMKDMSILGLEII